MRLADRKGAHCAKQKEEHMINIREGTPLAASVDDYISQNKIYGKVTADSCHCCGKPATTQYYDRPMCLSCARTAYRCVEIIKRSGGDAPCHDHSAPYMSNPHNL